MDTTLSLKDIHDEIAGRARLVVVTKEKSNDEIERFIAQGQSDFGENRWQVAKPKVERFPRALWHFIGNVQSNKLKYLLERFCLIHSIGSFSLAKILSDHKSEQPILLQVNISNEPQKGGFDRKDVLEPVYELGLNIRGFMGMAAADASEKEAKESFAFLRALADRSPIKNPIVSMGQSRDFRWALAEGSNMIRLGSLITI